MADSREVAFSVDIEELDKQLQEQREKAQEGVPIVARSTVFSLGLDPRLSTKPPIATPDFANIQILKDGLRNPYLQLNWRIDRKDVDSGRVVGFNVYRRKAGDTPVTFNDIKQLNRKAMDRLARGNKRTGDFSEERKAINNAKKGIIPLSILNPNLNEIKNFEQSRQFALDVSEEDPSYTNSQFTRFFSEKDFKKIAYVDYSKFVAEAKNKFLFIKERDFVDIYFRDKTVYYGETFEYYIQCQTTELGNGPVSETIKVTIDNFETVSAPQSLIAKQINETEIMLSIRMLESDHIEKALVFRRSEDDVFFSHLINAENLTDSIRVIDHDVTYGKTYTYRVFLVSMYGGISEPGEITVTSSVQKITSSSRSNDLKIPILTALQDQNSDYIRITISPNDARVAYYILRRLDTSIKERKYFIPSRDATNYGSSLGNPWPTDKFFVQSRQENISSLNLKNNASVSILNKRTTLKEIVFVDHTVSFGHIYKYVIQGFDLFGNPTPYAFATIKARGKKAVRSPINVKSEVVRDFPLRIKISWGDDNEATRILEDGTVSSNKIVYKVQRRKIGEIAYEDFPITQNKFLIDEVAATDALDFASTRNRRTVSTTIPAVDTGLARPFGIPNFLKENDIYFYRIIARDATAQESNATEEFPVITVPDLSDPIGFNSRILSTKVLPLVVGLFWGNNPLKSIPDKWTIERKTDSPYDTFRLVGQSYLLTKFLDINVKPGNTYIYRIKSYDLLGRESDFFQARVSV